MHIAPLSGYLKMPICSQKIIMIVIRRRKFSCLLRQLDKNGADVDMTQRIALLQARCAYASLFLFKYLHML